MGDEVIDSRKASDSHVPRSDLLLTLILTLANRYNTTGGDAESPEPAVPAGRHDVGGPRSYGVGLC